MFEYLVHVCCDLGAGNFFQMGKAFSFKGDPERTFTEVKLQQLVDWFKQACGESLGSRDEDGGGDDDVGDFSTLFLALFEKAKMKLGDGKKIEKLPWLRRSAVAAINPDNPQTVYLHVTITMGQIVSFSDSIVDKAMDLKVCLTGGKKDALFAVVDDNEWEPDEVFLPTTVNYFLRTGEKLLKDAGIQVAIIDLRGFEPLHKSIEKI